MLTLFIKSGRKTDLSAYMMINYDDIYSYYPTRKKNKKKL